MADISKNVIEKIKKGGVQPYPKKFFLFKRAIIWTLFVLSIMLGSIAIGAIIFQLKQAEWGVCHHLGLFKFLIIVSPHIWLFFFAGFTFIAVFYYRRTEGGYRLAAFWILLLSFVLSLTGGGLLYATGLSKITVNTLCDHVFFFRKMENHDREIWNSPQKGLIAGTIIKVISDKEIEITDLHGNPWIVDIGNTSWRNMNNHFESLEIKIIGKTEEKGRFIAYEIQPWHEKSTCKMKDH